MRRRPTAAEIVLLAVVITGGVMAARSGLRYGDAYRIGEDTYRRDGAADVLRVLVPGAVAVICLIVLTLSSLTDAGLRDQWRRERAEQKDAQAWSRRMQQ